MRLKPEKIERLAELIVEGLAGHDEIELAESRAQIEALIRRIFIEDMREEEAIEEDARAILDEHIEEIERKSLAYDKLLIKTKQKLARERKVVL